jgi:drug/metabolite transporter (DMT)-like permease
MSWTRSVSAAPVSCCTKEGPSITHESADRKFDIAGSLAILGFTLCWGAVPVMLRELTSSVDAWTANGIRYPLSAVLYWPVLWVFYRSKMLTSRTILLCAVPAGLAFCAQVLWALAPYYLPASAIGFFARFSFVWSLLGAMILFSDERKLLTTVGFYVGLLLSIGGFVVLSVSQGLLDAEVTWTGILIISVCSSLFGLYAVAVRWFLRRVHPVLGFGVVCQYVSAGTLVLMFSVGQPATLMRLTASRWVLIGTSSVLGIALGHALMYKAVQRLGAAIPSAVGTLTPMVTVALAAVFLGESLTAVEWAGGLAMLVGAMVLLGEQEVVLRSVRKSSRQLESRHS